MSHWSRPHRRRSSPPLGPTQSGRVGKEHLAYSRGALASHRDPNPLAGVRDGRSYEELGLVPIALELLDVSGAHKPVSVRTEERPSERSLDRGKRQIDVEDAGKRVNKRQPVGGLERPDLVRLEKHKGAFAPRDDSRRTDRPSSKGGAPLVQSFETLNHALVAERLEQVVDHAELESLERVAFVGRGENEHRRPREPSSVAYQREAALPARPIERDIDEHDV